MRPVGSLLACTILIGIAIVGFPRNATAASVDCFAYLYPGHEAADYHDLNADPIDNFTGLGKLLLPNRGCYVGYFSSGFPAKTGTQIWPDGSVYRGEFKTAGAHGEGVFTHRFGWSFSGSWFHEWPVRGTCTLDGESHPCEASGRGPDYRNWTTDERIRIPVLAHRYFDEFNLLRATEPLRGGLVFLGKEYELLTKIPDRKGRVYFTGSTQRTRDQIEQAIKPHRGSLRDLLELVRADYDDGSFRFEVTIGIAPSGMVESCSTDHYPEFCKEFRKIDFGIVDAAEPRMLTFSVSRYSFRLQDPAAE